MGSRSFSASWFAHRAGQSLRSPAHTRRLGRAIFGIFVLLALSSSPAAFAQFGASLNGTVQDATGAAIPGATITLTNTGNQQTRTATSSGGGAYNFSELAPGLYDVTATAPNFKPATLTNIQVEADPRTADITLDTGGTSTTVDVSASDTTVLQTSDASIGNTLNSETLERLPAIGGDVYELLRTAPGITGDASRSGAGTANFLPNGAGPASRTAASSRPRTRSRSAPPASRSGQTTT